MASECLESVEQLQAMQREWRELYAADPRASVFQSPEWILPWWRAFGSGSLRVIAVRCEGQLIGLAPLFLHFWQGRRQITFLGNGVSDRLQFLLRPRYEGEAARQIFNVLERHPDWDLCHLQDIPADSTWLTCAPAGSTVVPQYACMAIPLGTDWGGFLRQRPHGLRRNLDRYRKKLEADGTVEWKTAGADDFEQALDALLCLHRERWMEKERSAGMLDGEGKGRFHREAAMELAKAGAVRMNYMVWRGRIAAVNYVIAEGTSALGYACAFDPGLARYSPGALMLAYTLERAMMEGMRTFDFLRGDEPYKAQWGAEPYTTMELVWRGH